MHTVRPHPWPANLENLEMEPRNLCCNKLSRWFWRTLKFDNHCIDILTDPIQHVVSMGEIILVKAHDWRQTTYSVQFSHSVMSDFSKPWTVACQACVSITNSRSLLKLMSIESVMPSYHLILWRPLLLPPSIFPSIRVFSSESALLIKWLKYWSFSFSISPFNEYLGLISFSIDWFDLLAVQRTLESSPAPQFKSPEAPWKGPLGKFPWKHLQVWLLPAHGITMKFTEIQRCGKRAETLPVQQMGLVTQRRGELLDFGDDSRNSVLPPWLPLRGLSS